MYKIVILLNKMKIVVFIKILKINNLPIKSNNLIKNNKAKNKYKILIRKYTKKRFSMNYIKIENKFNKKQYNRKCNNKI